MGGAVTATAAGRGVDGWVSSLGVWGWGVRRLDYTRQRPRGRNAPLGGVIVSS